MESLRFRDERPHLAGKLAMRLKATAMPAQQINTLVEAMLGELESHFCGLRVYFPTSPSRRHAPLDPLFVRRVHELASAGVPQRGIAAALGASRNQVRRALGVIFP